MPNLVLTYQCNNDCQFCFARDQMPKCDLTLEKVKQLLPFIQSFNREGVNIVGGEPTLNLDFPKILEFLLAAGLRVRVFTNGKLPIDLIVQLQNEHGDEFSFCVNRTQPQLTPEIIRFYRKLGYRIQLSVTVFDPDQAIDHIFDEIITYNLGAQYRLGIALPTWQDRISIFLSPDTYPEIADKIFSFIQKGVSFGIRATFDCGFPYCFFSEDQKKYFKNNDIKFASNCGIIPDIGPDFSAIPCFPLAKFRQPISSELDWQWLQKTFNEKFEPHCYKPLFQKCKDCEELQSKNCSGGCAAFRIIS